MRLIVWAIPILGFLGTVIGITMALNAIDPKAVEESMMQVTTGLGVKFDTTALALAWALRRLLRGGEAVAVEAGAVSDADPQHVVAEQESGIVGVVVPDREVHPGDEKGVGLVRRLEGPVERRGIRVNMPMSRSATSSPLASAIAFLAAITPSSTEP